jgi:PhoH-like ATPase
VSRTLDALRGSGRLNEGVPMPNGGRLRIVCPTHNKRQNGNGHFGSYSVDNRILSLAMEIKKKEPRSQTILVSKDINLRIKADAVGIPAEDYENDRIFIQDLYTGMIEIMTTTEKMASFRVNGELELEPGKQFYPNEYCTLAEEVNPKRTALLVDPTGKS